MHIIIEKVIWWIMTLSVKICLMKLCEINFTHKAHLFFWGDVYKYLCATCPSYESFYKSYNSLWQLVPPWGHLFLFVLFLKMCIWINTNWYASKSSTTFLFFPLNWKKVSFICRFASPVAVLCTGRLWSRIWSLGNSALQKHHYYCTQSSLCWVQMERN